MKLLKSILLTVAALSTVSALTGCAGAGNWEAAQQSAANYGVAYMANNMQSQPSGINQQVLMNQQLMQTNNQLRQMQMQQQMQDFNNNLQHDLDKYGY